MSELTERARKVLNDLTSGLLQEEQEAIVEAVRSRMLERAGEAFGIVELHCVDRAGNGHWLVVTEQEADVLLRAEIERD
jgi:hypothetical protein